MTDEEVRRRYEWLYRFSLPAPLPATREGLEALHRPGPIETPAQFECAMRLHQYFLDRLHQNTVGEFNAVQQAYFREVLDDVRRFVDRRSERA